MRMNALRVYGPEHAWQHKLVHAHRPMKSVIVFNYGKAELAMKQKVG